MRWATFHCETPMRAAQAGNKLLMLVLACADQPEAVDGGALVNLESLGTESPGRRHRLRGPHRRARATA